MILINQLIVDVMQTLFYHLQAQIDFDSILDV